MEPVVLPGSGRSASRTQDRAAFVNREVGRRMRALVDAEDARPSIPYGELKMPEELKGTAFVGN